MDAKDQRNIIIVLLIGIFIALVKPDVFRLATLEVATEQTDRGREHDGNQNRAQSPQNIRTLDPAIKLG